MNRELRRYGLKSDKPRVVTYLEGTIRKSRSFENASEMAAWLDANGNTIEPVEVRRITDKRLFFLSGSERRVRWDREKRMFPILDAAIEQMQELGADVDHIAEELEKVADILHGQYGQVKELAERIIESCHQGDRDLDEATDDLWSVAEEHGFSQETLDAARAYAARFIRKRAQVMLMLHMPAEFEPGCYTAVAQTSRTVKKLPDQ